ncbi:hypothetical protein IMSAGC003_02743 [Lachnospiraceae bacterium]|nr:peptidoglycan DD-metalloendopeptidase family protein [Acetatifactor sp.]GFH96189.1 hypothetical protein IMSAGC003_02743 [Lachnospiraceae bacterium]
MKTKKHKRKTNRVVIVASDAVDAGVRHLRLSHWVFRVLMVVFCVAVGYVVGRIIYEEQYKSRVWQIANQKIAEAQAANEEMQEKLAAAESGSLDMQSQVIALKSKIDLLSDTVNQKTEEMNALAEKIQQQGIPSRFPMTGSASIDEITDGEPACILNGTEGTVVVAAATGVVTEVGEDADYGSRVVLDHGNGYVTIYRNKGNCLVKVGDTVAQGGALYYIGSDNTKLGYQIQQDGTYISPMQLIDISG